MPVNKFKQIIPSTFSDLLGHRSVLLLQGPIGLFFNELAKVLVASGCCVHKVHFNGGDCLFYNATSATNFRGREQEWPAFLRQLLKQHGVDAIALFGQTRKLNAKARKIAKQLGIEVFVFEEGYVRPSYVTLEKDGVNGFSRLPKNPAAYADWHDRLGGYPKPSNTHQRFRRTAWMAMAYGLAMWLSQPYFPHYRHHRCMHPVFEGLRWVRGGIRKLKYAFLERNMQAFLASEKMRKKWFIVPLQVCNDSQIHVHSSYNSMSEFIALVMRNFAKEARRSDALVFKHHPLDKPYSDCSSLIKSLARELGLEGRVYYVHDLHLPTLLAAAKGMLAINSTSGLQAMHHQCPVKVMGQCIYNIPTLTHQGTLRSFWRNPGKVNKALYLDFKSYVIFHTQLNASYYASMPALEGFTDDEVPELDLESELSQSH